jgi:hypothetical protein
MRSSPARLLRFCGGHRSRLGAAPILRLQDARRYPPLSRLSSHRERGIILSNSAEFIPACAAPWRNPGDQESRFCVPFGGEQRPDALSFATLREARKDLDTDNTRRL